MADKAQNLSPPYASFPAFINFLNKLRETTIPGRIDPSVFGKASGSIAYSILASLKFLKLISADGTPLPQFIALVNAADDERKPMLREMIQAGYPSLWDGSLDVTKATAGQFDEHIREEFDVKGSTVDKVATFFIQAAKAADLTISPHLAARRPVAGSASAGKSRKQRRSDAAEIDAPSATPTPPPAAAKALEYQLIDLMKREGIGDAEQEAIWTLVRFLTKPQAA